MTGKPEFISFLVQQDVKTKLDVIDALMESLSPGDREMLIHSELEWLSPIGLERARAKLAELEFVPFEPFNPCEDCDGDCRCEAKCEKKDTAKVPKETIQEDYIKVGDKVRVNSGEDFGYSFIVESISYGSIAGDHEGNYWEFKFLEVCDE